MTSEPSSPFLGASTRANWLLSFAALVVAAIYGFGLPALNRLVPGTAPQAGGTRVDLGHGVTVVTPAGWLADVPRMNPGETLALVNEASSLVATTFPWEGDEAGMIERLRLLFESTRRFHLQGTPEPFRTPAGVAGVTVALYGEQADGRVWILRLPGEKFGAAVRVRSVPGQGNSAMPDAISLVESMQIKEVK